jgi:hypothetical protein
MMNHTDLHTDLHLSGAMLAKSSILGSAVRGNEDTNPYWPWFRCFRVG